MHRKCLLALLFVISTWVMTGTATASETRWYTHEEVGLHGTPIAEGIHELAEGTGSLFVSLKRKHVSPSLIKAKCSVEIVETVWNEPTQGFGETQSLAFTTCQPAPIPSTDAEVCPRPIVSANNLPGWPAKVFGEEHPINVEMEHVGMTFTCEGAEGALGEGITLKGTLIPQQGDADEQCEGFGDDVDNQLNFVNKIERTIGIKELAPRLEGSGTFEGLGYSLGLTGTVKLGPKGEGFAAEVFPCKSKGLGK